MQRCGFNVIMKVLFMFVWLFSKNVRQHFFSSLSKYKTADYIITEALIYCYWDPKDNVSTKQDSRLQFVIHLGTFCIHYESLLDAMFKVWLIEKERSQHKTKLEQTCLISCNSYSKRCYWFRKVFKFLFTVYFLSLLVFQPTQYSKLFKEEPLISQPIWSTRQCVSFNVKPLKLSNECGRPELGSAVRVPAPTSSY